MKVPRNLFVKMKGSLSLVTVETMFSRFCFKILKQILFVKTEDSSEGFLWRMKVPESIFVEMKHFLFDDLQFCKRLEVPLEIKVVQILLIYRDSMFLRTCLRKCKILKEFIGLCFWLENAHGHQRFS